MRSGLMSASTMMLMGFPADMAVLLEEKARDAYVVLEAAVRGKKALAERVAAAKTVGTRRERASMSLTHQTTWDRAMDLCRLALW